MKAFRLFSSLTLVCASVSAQQAFGGKNALPGPPRFVVVGDSLSAAVQNFSLLDSQQPNGYASIIARQAGWPLTLPLVPYPGAPSVLQVTDPAPPIQISAVPETLTCTLFTFFTCLRDNPWVQPTNIAVPGLTVDSALNLRPTIPTASTPPQQIWATIVLGFPNLPFRAPTEIEEAKILRPNLLINWLGNNDALVPALTGVTAALTPNDVFLADYHSIMEQLKSTGARIITANVPDVTEVGYFSSVQTIADKYDAGNVSDAAARMGVGVNDYIRTTASDYVYGIFVRHDQGPLPATGCPAGILGTIGAPGVPCVLTAADASTIRASVNCYNKIISSETKSHDAILVDIHALVDHIYTSGTPVGGEILTTDFLGGLFSLDGIHPSNTGYGIIANEFIRVMNAQLGTNIRSANVDAIYKRDPLRDYADPNFKARTLPDEPIGACPVS